MYVTLPGITNSQSIQLIHTIENLDGQLEVSLCDVTCYPRWTNISAARYNNQIFINRKRCFIHDGYYSVCSLIDESFKPFGVSLTQNESNRMLIFNAGEDEVLIALNIAETLGLNTTQLNSAGS